MADVLSEQLGGLPPERPLHRDVGRPPVRAVPGHQVLVVEEKHGGARRTKPPLVTPESDARDKHSQTRNCESLLFYHHPRQRFSEKHVLSSLFLDSHQLL